MTLTSKYSVSCNVYAHIINNKRPGHIMFRMILCPTYDFLFLKFWASFGFYRQFPMTPIGIIRKITTFHDAHAVIDA